MNLHLQHGELLKSKALTLFVGAAIALSLLLVSSGKVYANPVNTKPLLVTNLDDSDNNTYDNSDNSNPNGDNNAVNNNTDDNNGYNDSDNMDQVKGLTPDTPLTPGKTIIENAKDPTDPNGTTLQQDWDRANSGGEASAK